MDSSSVAASLPMSRAITMRLPIEPQKEPNEIKTENARFSPGTRSNYARLYFQMYFRGSSYENCKQAQSAKISRCLGSGLSRSRARSRRLGPAKSSVLSIKPTKPGRPLNQKWYIRSMKTRKTSRAKFAPCARIRRRSYRTVQHPSPRR